MDPCLLWTFPGLKIIKIVRLSSISCLLQEAVSGDPATYLDQFVPDSVDKEAEVAQRLQISSAPEQLNLVKLLMIKISIL